MCVWCGSSFSTIFIYVFIRFHCGRTRHTFLLVWRRADKLCNFTLLKMVLRTAKTHPSIFHGFLLDTLFDIIFFSLFVCGNLHSLLHWSRSHCSHIVSYSIATLRPILWIQWNWSHKLYRNNKTLTIELGVFVTQRTLLILSLPLALFLGLSSFVLLKSIECAVASCWSQILLWNGTFHNVFGFANTQTISCRFSVEYNLVA